MPENTNQNPTTVPVAATPTPVQNTNAVPENPPAVPATPTPAPATIAETTPVAVSSVPAATNTPPAPAPAPNPDKERLNQAIQENQRDRKQELTEIVRYPGLKLITGWAKLTGIILGIIFALLSIIALIFIFGKDTTWFEGLTNFILLFCIGLFIFCICYAAGDFAQLMIDTEENTRKMAKEAENKK